MKILLLVASVLGVLLAAPGTTHADDPGRHGPAVWPLTGSSPEGRPTVVAGFDPPDSPWGSGHRGVDLLGSAGEPVHAALAGRITFAGTLAGRGVVVVDHGGMRTTYEPVQPSVHVGADVPTGGLIGTLQSGLSHCFPRTCLHWGLIRRDQYLDPLSLLGRAPVRLLPLALPLGLMPWGGPAGMPPAAVRP